MIVEPTDTQKEETMPDNTDNASALARLEAAYGPPSQAGFGSAVFHQALEPAADLVAAAQERYRDFVGELWERWGEAAWMSPWREVYSRPAGATHDIVAELRALDDPDATLSVPMILENDPAALAAVFDHPSMTELRVFTLGDGQAMSGLLLAGRQAEENQVTCLVFLMD